MRASARMRVAPVAVPRPPFVLKGLGYGSIITPGGARISVDPTYAPGSTYAPGNTAPPAFANGTLIASPSSQWIYLMVNGQASRIPDWNTYVAMGFPTAPSSNNKFLPAAVHQITDAQFNAIPLGAPQPAMTPGQAPPVATAPVQAPVAVASTPVTPSVVPNGQIATVMEPGAVWNAQYGAYLNPDGSMYYGANSSATAGSLISATPTGVVASVMEPGAVYDAAIGGYLNPDGSVYYGANTATTSTIDLTSPSTWPTWLWVVGVGGLAFFMMKKR